VLWATRYLLWGFIQGERLLPVTAAKQAAEKLQLWGFVTGHDFSRADKAHRINWALAPLQMTVGPICWEISPFSAACNAPPFESLILATSIIPFQA
jgi:hypothetical protein